MTLNIALVSREALYLSGDFRITYSNGAWVDDLNAQKLIPVVKFGWCGLISFCGVAKTAAGRNVGDWIAEQTQPETPRQSIREVAGRLMNAEAWLGQFSRGDRRFSMCFLGFDRRRPFFYLLSNFQHPDRHVRARQGTALQEYFERPKSEDVRSYPVVLADAEAAPLRTALTDNSGGDIATLLAGINAQVAERNKTVSSACVVGSAKITGHAQIAPFGVPEDVEYFPGFMKRQAAAAGIADFKRKTDVNGVELPIRWKGSGYAIQPRDDGSEMFAASFAMGNVLEPIAGPRAFKGSTYFKIVESTNEQIPAIHYTVSKRRKPRPYDR